MGPQFREPSTQASGISDRLDRLANLLRAHTPDRLQVFWEHAMAKKRPTPPTLSEAMLRTIRERELTAYALSKLTGVSATVLQRWVNGERDIRLKTANKIASALGLDLVARE
jgi:DNA-binding phage protein